jgi:hypothetical protein
MVTLRSNWKLYVEEFATALTLAGYKALARPYLPEKTITAFERKYHLAEQALWECRCAISSGS